MALLNPAAAVGRRAVATLRTGRSLLFALVLGASPRLAAAVPPPAEYQLKAVFLFNFAQFVEWPANTFAKAEAPLVIGIVGEDPFGAYLDELVHDEKINGHPLVVRRFRHGDEVRDCHLMFVARSESRDLGRTLSRVQGRSILTVSDADGFIREGGMVRFAMEAGKIRLRINSEAAKAGGLTISSKLLRLGTLVRANQD